MLRALLLLGALGLAYWYTQQTGSDATDTTDATLGTPDLASFSGDDTSGDATVATGSSSGGYGLRDNNPFNIEWNANNNWQGQTGQDGRFCVFDGPQNGYRAGFILLINWNKNYGLNTVAGIINRQAPPNENATSSYAQFVADQLGVNPYDTLNMGDTGTLTSLAKAITQFELGQLPWDDTVIQGGLNDALAAKGLQVQA